MSQTSAVQVVCDVKAAVGEGPCWDPATGTLSFVDLLPGTIYEFDPSRGSVSSLLTAGERINGVLPRKSGGLLAVTSRAITRIDKSSGTLETLTAVEFENPLASLNDARCDPVGRLWAGSLIYDFERDAPVEGAGVLYRFDVDGSYSAVLDGYTMPNGLDFSPDGTTLYIAESAEHRIDAFDYDVSSGEIANRRPLVELDDGLGLPDGMAVDEEGHLWIARFGGGCVQRFAPDGRPSGRVDVPAAMTTSLAFGGLDYRDLYITTATYSRTPEQLAEEPFSGAVFVCRPGVAGRPTPPYGG